MNNNKKIIDITTIQYYEKIDTIFTLRNDYFMCPPFNSYKILNDYDKNNIVIKDTKIFYNEKNNEGAGYKQYHDISFHTHGKHEINIQNLRTNKIQTYTFKIWSAGQSPATTNGEGGSKAT